MSKSNAVNMIEKAREFEEANLRAAKYYLTLPKEDYPALHDFARRVLDRQPVNVRPAVPKERYRS